MASDAVVAAVRSMDVVGAGELATVASVSLVTEILDIFERYGLRYQDDDSAGRAITMVREAALVYGGQPTSSIAMTSVSLSRRQQRLLGEMCENALISLTVGIKTCKRCNAGVCRPHARALARARSYSSLARQLGIHAAS
jgi:hypothetical protein